MIADIFGCSHVKETECGIKEAVEKNRINKNRYNSYCLIYEDLKRKDDKKW